MLNEHCSLSIGHNGTVVCMLYPKISTSWEKLAPTGRHSRHVFATLSLTQMHKCLTERVEKHMCDGDIHCVTYCNTHCDTGLCIAQCKLQTFFAIVVEVTNHQQPNYCGLASLLKARQGDIEEVSGSLSCANLRVWRVLVPFQGKVAPGHRAEI